MTKATVKVKKTNLKKGDMVMVITGKDVGKKGKIISTDPKTGRIYVDKINIVSRHTKPTQSSPQGGIVKKEAAIDASNVMLFCDKCNQPVRINKEFSADGGKQRKCNKCGAIFDDKSSK
ncbi:MAG: 50S ribosomal protein L24 [Bacillota bacterium]|jgi:large subunit ribosomal protein L24